MPSKRKLRGGDPILQKTRESARALEAAPSVVFPLMTCVIIFLITLVIFFSAGESPSFGVYVVCISLMAMNVAASASFVLFQKSLENETHVQIFLGIAAVSFACWGFFAYGAYHKRESFINQDKEDDTE
jgi:hypothetical protein